MFLLFQFPDTLSADTSNLSLPRFWNGVGFLIMIAEPVLLVTLRSNIGRILCLVLSLWTVLKRKHLTWQGHICTAKHLTHSPLGPMWHPSAMRSSWFLSFVCPECVLQWQICVASCYFYSTVLTVCIAWHKVLEGVRSPGGCLRWRWGKFIPFLPVWWRAWKKIVLTTFLRFPPVGGGWQIPKRRLRANIWCRWLRNLWEETESESNWVTQTFFCPPSTLLRLLFKNP